MQSKFMRLTSLVAIAAMFQMLLQPNIALAGDAETRAKCAAGGSGATQARAATTGAVVTTYSATRARSLGLRPAVRAPHVRAHAPRFHGHVGGGIAGILIGVAVSVAISAIAEEAARADAEKSCLLAHGLIKPANPNAPPSREGADGVRRGISVAPTSHCACPQMKTCSGSWATMSCKRLVDLCQNPRDTIQYMRNGCDKLKQLVGF